MVSQNPIVIVWQLADVAAIRDLPSIDIMKELIPIKWRLKKHRRSKKKDAQTFNLAQKSFQGYPDTYYERALLEVSPF
mgnify:CR=1 FL=1